MANSHIHWSCSWDTQSPHRVPTAGVFYNFPNPVGLGLIFNVNSNDSWSTSVPGFPVVVCVASSRCHERGSTPETKLHILDYQWLYHWLVIKSMNDSLDNSHPSPLKLGLQVEVLLDRKAVSQWHKVGHNTTPSRTVIQDGPSHHPIAKPHVTRANHLIA